ncbi:MAG: hypothetical protein ACK4RV_10095 [Caulobacter sp.]
MTREPIAMIRHGGELTKAEQRRRQGLIAEAIAFDRQYLSTARKTIAEHESSGVVRRFIDHVLLDVPALRQVVEESDARGHGPRLALVLACFDYQDMLLEVAARLELANELTRPKRAAFAPTPKDPTP